MSAPAGRPDESAPDPNATISNVMWELLCIQQVMELVVDDEASDVPGPVVLWLAAQVGRTQVLLDKADMARNRKVQP